MNDAIKFAIEVDHKGTGKITLDGHDISKNVQSVRFSARAGEATVVTVDFVNVDVTAIGSVARQYKA